MTTDRIDEDTIHRLWDIFRVNNNCSQAEIDVGLGEDDVTELRILTKGNKSFSGYFQNVDSFIDAVRGHMNDACYFTLNPIKKECMSRSTGDSLKSTYEEKILQSKDNEIAWRKWVLIDLDPKRITGVNATDEEKAVALKTARIIFKYLREIGFSTPIMCDSGNGYHLLYRVKMKNEEQQMNLIKNFLKRLAMLFNSETIDIDTTVYNASRICKLYGTFSRKGRDTEERPQRISKIMYVPDTIEITDPAYFQKVVDSIKLEQEPKTFNNNYGRGFNIDDFLRDNGIGIHSDVTTGKVRKIILDHCVFDEQHKAPDAAIFVSDEGIGYKCFHNSCADYKWSDVRKKFDPNYGTYNPRQQNNIQGPPPFTPEYFRPHKEKVALKKENSKDGKKWLNLDEIEDKDRSDMIIIPTGLNCIDTRLYGSNCGEVSIWSGSNSSGKSTVLSQLALNAINKGYKVGIWSGELKATQTKNWMSQIAAGKQHVVASKQYVGSYYTTKETKDQIAKWTKDKLFIYNNEYGNNFEQLRTDMLQLVKDKGVRLLIVDNMMATDLSCYEGNELIQQKKFILDLKRMASDEEIHIHIVCHPRKANSFLRKNDIAGTGDLTNSVDNVFIVHRINQDFETKIKDFYPASVWESLLDKENEYGNAIECCKNRDLGDQDWISGTVYEKQSKRFLNDKYENVSYGWIQPLFEHVKKEVNEVVGDNPIDFSTDNTLSSYNEGLPF